MGRAHTFFPADFRRRAREAAAVVAGCSFFVACYAYSAIPAASAPNSGTVRLTLVPSSYSQSLGTLGSQIASVEGEVRSITDSSVTISVTEVGRATLDNEQFHGETVTVPKQSIAAVDRRHIDAARSLTLTGLIVGGALWIAASLGGGSVNQVHQKGPSTGQ